jgi:hypothetical protein
MACQSQLIRPGVVLRGRERESHDAGRLGRALRKIIELEAESRLRHLQDLKGRSEMTLVRS